MKNTKHLIFTALCMALGVVLPMAFHMIPNAGSVMLPMHIPVLLCGLVCGMVGVVIALMLLLLGFWRALFVALFFAAGYFVGAFQNKTELIKGWINRLFPPKGE